MIKATVYGDGFNSRIALYLGDDRGNQLILEQTGGSSDQGPELLEMLQRLLFTQSREPWPVVQRRLVCAIHAQEVIREDGDRVYCSACDNQRLLLTAARSEAIMFREEVRRLSDLLGWAERDVRSTGVPDVDVPYELIPPGARPAWSRRSLAVEAVERARAGNPPAAPPSPVKLESGPLTRATKAIIPS